MQCWAKINVLLCIFINYSRMCRSVHVYVKLTRDKAWGEARQQVYKIRSYENTFMILKNKFGTFLTKE